MKKTKLWLFITVLAVMALLTGSVYTYAYHATAGGSIALKKADGTNAGSTDAYSPKATCARACHIADGDGVDFVGHDYGSGDKYSTHVQGVLASGSTSTVYWEASQTKSFEHGVSAGRHMNQGRNEDYTNTYRAKYGDPFFTSSAGMYGKY